MNYVVFHNGGRFIGAYLLTEIVEAGYNGLEFFVYDSLPSEIENLKDDEDAYIAEDGAITIKAKPPELLTAENRIAKMEEDNAALLMQVAEQKSQLDQQGEESASLLMILAEKGILI